MGPTIHSRNTFGIILTNNINAGVSLYILSIQMMIIKQVKN